MPMLSSICRLHHIFHFSYLKKIYYLYFSDLPSVGSLSLYVFKENESKKKRKERSVFVGKLINLISNDILFRNQSFCVQK